MSTIANELAELLSTVRRPGDFFVSGRTEFLAPRIEVDGVGPVSLPLLPVQAAQLVAVAERAPYGRGADTIVDTSVRRTWQIAQDRVHLAGKHWSRTLDQTVVRVAEGLGVSEPVSAELYKLLVYDAGSFFVSHRDTEKSPGMFATLVLALPSISTGGELVVKHQGREVRLDLKCEEPSEIAFAAFYADCVHEVLPVTAGCRATLVYNLVRAGKGALPQPPSYDSETARAIALLRGWAKLKQASSEDAPEKLIYPLEHAYTPAALDFGQLKGADAAVARVLIAAAPEAACDLHLALLSIEESGAAEHQGSYRSRYYRGEDDEDEFEVVEVFDRSETLSEWRRPDGTSTALGALPIEDDEVSPPDALEDMEPDEEEFHEATGNEGASFDRTYRRAALVLWPSARTLAVLNQAGLSAMLPYLEELTAKWSAAGADPHSPWRRQAHELASLMLATWPAREWYRRESTEPSETGRLASLLARLGDKQHAEALIAKLMAQGGHDEADNEAILQALGLFPSKRAADLFQRIVAANAVASLGACGALLSGAITTLFATKPAELIKAAHALVDALPGNSQQTPAESWKWRPATASAGFVVDLVRVVEAVDNSLAEKAATHMLAWPRHFDVDSVLVPAVKLLIEAGAPKRGPAFSPLHAACLAHLKRRAAEPLEPPSDWSRESKLDCQCAHCSALGRFLADAAAPTWTLKAAQLVRSHVEATIKNARCDLDVRTERRGSPHGLVCTKNQASYKRRVAQRNQDLADISCMNTSTGTPDG